MDKETIIKNLADILSDNLGQRLTIALATGIVNLVGQELSKETSPAPNDVEAG